MQFYKTGVGVGRKWSGTWHLSPQTGWKPKGLYSKGHLETTGIISAVMLASEDMDSELRRSAMPTAVGHTTWHLGIYNEGDGLPFRRCPLAQTPFSSKGYWCQ